MANEISSRLVTVASHSHHDMLVNGLWDLFLTQRGTDYDLRLGDHSIRAHQLVVNIFLSPATHVVGVLAGGEGWGHQQSSSETTENGTCQLISEASNQTSRGCERLANRLDEDRRCLDALLEFLYNGAVSVPENRLCKLHKIAKQMNFKLLADAVEATMIVEAARSLGICVRSQQQTDSAVRRQLQRRCLKPSKLATLLDGCSESQLPSGAVKSSAQLSSSLGSETRASETGRQRIGRPSRRITSRNVGTSIEVKSDNMGSDSEQLSGDDRTRPVVTIKAERLKSWMKLNPMLRCNHCDFKSRSKKHFQVHVVMHDTGDMVVHKCPICAKQFQTEELLVAHNLTHDVQSGGTGEVPSICCPYCEFETPKRWKYVYHLKSVHEVNAKGDAAPKKNLCMDCNQSFVCLSVLKVHQRIKHTNVRPFQCSLCPYAAKRKGDLGIHHKVSHLKLRPVICEMCGFRAISVSALMRHKRTHSGEKPFQCHECGQSFSDMTSFKRHVKRHASSGKHTHTCHVCGQAFNERYILNVHLRRSHKLATAKSSRQEVMNWNDASSVSVKGLRIG